jgi:branched-chain amino acid transport system ATP-binding protein
VERHLLTIEGLYKYYGGLAAVHDLSAAVGEGEILGIAGPNGAGKTTLFDTISGYARASRGRVMLGERQIERLSAHRITHLGIARTFQIPSVFDSQSVFANALVASYFGAANRFVPGLRFDRHSVERADLALEFVGLETKRDSVAGPLPLFDKKRLMLACALATEPRVLLLDEIAGGLNPGETDAIFDLVRDVRSERGLAIVVIEHVMRALMAISDRVMIMHHGAKLYEGPPADVLANEDVIRVYLGREAQKFVAGGNADEDGAHA